MLFSQQAVGSQQKRENEIPGDQDRRWQKKVETSILLSNTGSKPARVLQISEKQRPSMEASGIGRSNERNPGGR